MVGSRLSVPPLLGYRGSQVSDPRALRFWQEHQLLARESSLAVAFGLETHKRTALKQNKPHKFPRDETLLGFVRVLFL